MQCPTLNQLFGRWFNKLNVLNDLPAKDPMDWSLTPSSTKWETERYCPTCKKTTSHEEHMADICNGCGSFNKQLLYSYRVYRKIWDGTAWKYQYKYGNMPDQYVIADKPYN